jgi:protocatechuate 3,4-dioxygenase beta subunit
MFLSMMMRTIAAIAVPGLSAGLTFGFAPTAFSPQEAKSALNEAKPAPPAPMTTPITVRGRATDSEGEPVAGAT